MTESIDFFTSLPLWFSVPLVAVYLAMLAYVVYISWIYRKP